MEAVLAQSFFTPSPFSNSDLPFQLSQRGYSGPGYEAFIEDNQQLKKTSAPVVDLQSSRVAAQDGFIEQEEYKGFAVAEWGDIELGYNKESVSFFYNLRFLGLRREGSNTLYPEPYLFVCGELELEGVGGSKKAAWEDLVQCLSVYFNRTREAYEKPGDYLEAITSQIRRKNQWKQRFSNTYNRVQNLEKININHEYQIS